MSTYVATPPMNELLAAQVRDHFGSLSAVPEEFRDFLETVNATYERSSSEPEVFEGVVESSAFELVERCRELQQALAESRRSERELQNALALLTGTMDATQDGVLVVDVEGRLVRTNRGFADLWNIPDEVVESHDYERMLEITCEQVESPDEFLSKIREMWENPEAESFDVVRFKDGRTYERRSKPQRVGGEVVGRIWSFRDVSSRARLEEQLRQSQKLEAIGSLAGGIAHDFNNLLTVIGGHLTLVLQDPELTMEQREDLTQCLEAADRAAKLTHQLLAFARRQVLVPAALDLNEIVDSIGPLLSRLIGDDVELVTELGSELPSVLADPGQIEQVIMNLAVNARDAMPDGGRLTIGTRSLDPWQNGGGDSTESVVELWVSDTGCGIPQPELDRIFEPFFTTKPAGKGTGLGLATVYGIVAQSGGEVRVESEEKVGTVFRIRFPVHESVKTAVPVVSLGYAEQDPGSGTILVAEDAAALRRFIERSLRLQGYTVLTAANGREALQIARENAHRIDLILTDVVMPGMSGQEFVSRIRRFLPEIPVVFMSGYTDDEILRRGNLAPDTAFLQKPFTLEELATAMSEGIVQSVRIGMRARPFEVAAASG